MLDLKAIKARRAKDYRVSQNEVVSHILFGQVFADIDALLLEVERLAKENKQLEEYREQYYSMIRYLHKREDY